MLIAGDIGGTETDLVKVSSTGGIYIAGGVAVHTMTAHQRPGFMQSFTRKGRITELMGRIPIQVMVSQAGLAGAAADGLESSKN